MCGIDEVAAVGKRIRRQIENAHHRRAAGREQRFERRSLRVVGRVSMGKGARHGRQRFARRGRACQPRRRARNGRLNS